MDQNTNKKLKIASTEELTQLLKLSVPKYSLTYGIIDMHIRFNIFKGTPVKIFVPVGENPISLIVLHHDCDEPHPNGRQMIDIYYDVNRASDIQIQDYLKSLPNINWNKPITFIGNYDIVAEKLKSILESPSLCGKLESVDVFSDCHVYAHDGSSSKSVTIPDGFELDTLKPHHVAYVHEMFGNPIWESDDFVAQQFRKFPTIGLYKTNSDGGRADFPVSWATFGMHGNVRRVFTTQDFRRRGFSTIVMVEYLKALHKAGIEPKANISRTNALSIKMHENLGFRKQDRCACATFSSENKS